MRFSGKMRLTIILIVTKNQGLTLTLENAFFEKSQGEGWGGGGGGGGGQTNFTENFSCVCSL